MLWYQPKKVSRVLSLYIVWCVSICYIIKIADLDDIMAGMLFWSLIECSLLLKILPLFKSDLVFISEKLLTCSVVCLALSDAAGSFLAVADCY